jgi:hypothetical protein
MFRPLPRAILRGIFKTKYFAYLAVYLRMLCSCHSLVIFVVSPYSTSWFTVGVCSACILCCIYPEDNL